MIGMNCLPKLFSVQCVPSAKDAVSNKKSINLSVHIPEHGREGGMV